MQPTINIEGTDRTQYIDPSTFNLQRALTSQTDVFRFTIVKTPTRNYKPSVLDDVEVLEGSTVIFGGQIVEVSERIEGKDIELIDCVAKDYAFDMDRTMVIASYEDMSVNEIIDDINTNFLTGYNIDNVNCTFNVDYIAFNYEYPSKCLQQLAELTGYDWYVDADKNIFFFSKVDNLAPFNLTDDNESYYYNSLNLHRDIKNLRNTIIVRGGEYQGSTTSETVVADGQALIYKQGQRYSNVTVTVDGVSKTVGIDNISDPTAYDCLYNYQEKFVRFTASTKPANTKNVVVGGNPHIPVIVKVKDPVSIAQYGAFEYKIIDKSIISKEAARDRAKAEIQSWASQLNDGTFETKSAGLDVGQYITVDSTIRSISSEKYVISRITSKLAPNATEFLHTVTLVTSQKYGMVEFLQKLLMNKDKEIVINKDEVLDEVESINELITITEAPVVVSKVHNPQTETITIGESATVQSLNYPVVFCVTPCTPSGTHRPFILNGSRLG